MSAAPTLVDALGPLRSDPPRAAVLFDVDGTLAPIVRHADEAAVPQPTRSLLIEVARRYGVVACVTGRRASDARRMVGIGTIHYIGTHGTELLRAGWTDPVLEPEVREWAPRVQAFGHAVETPDMRKLRIRREDKAAIVAFHWRGAPDEGAAHATVRQIAEQAEREGFATHWGRKVLEVRPPVRMDKGVGITSFLESENVDVAMYAGDDVTDLDAFRALVELQESGRLRYGLRVGVVSDEAPSQIADESDVTVDGPPGVIALLEALISP